MVSKKFVIENEQGLHMRDVYKRQVHGIPDGKSTWKQPH